MSISHYDEGGAQTSHHTHCCILELKALCTVLWETAVYYLFSRYLNPIPACCIKKVFKNGTTQVRYLKTCNVIRIRHKRIVSASTEVYRSSFCEWTVREWNLLPLFIGTLCSLPSIMNGLSSFSPPASLQTPLCFYPINFHYHFFFLFYFHLLTSRHSLKYSL